MGLLDPDTWTPALLTAGLMLGVTACAAVSPERAGTRAPLRCLRRDGHTLT